MKNKSIQSKMDIQFEESLLQKEEYQNPDYLFLLLKKNFTIALRNPKNLIFIVIAPFIISTIIFLLQHSTRQVGQRTIQNPEIFQVKQGDIKCKVKNCISLHYLTVKQIPSSDNFVTSTIKYIKQKQKLQDSDIQYFDDLILNSSQNYNAYIQKLKKYPGKYQIGLIFCNSDNINYEQLSLNCSNLNISNYSFPNSYPYLIVLNRTSGFKNLILDFLLPMQIDHTALALKVRTDQGILNYINDSISINFQRQSYPSLPNKFLQNYDIITQVGAFYYMITPLFSMIFILNQIVREKQYKLRQGIIQLSGLNIYGVSHFIYWISWIVVIFVYTIIITLCSIASGAVFGFGFFTQTPFYILLMVFLPFIFSMQVLGFVISTFVSNLKMVSSLSYVFVLLAIIIQYFIFNQNVLKYFFIQDPNIIIWLINIILPFYPSFNYSKIFASISTQSGYHFNLETRYWIKGNGFTWDNFTSTYHHYTITGQKIKIYSSLISMGVLYLNIIFFFFLFWYFDHIIQSNRGVSQNLLFFLSTNYWCKKKRNNKVYEQTELIKQLFINYEEDESVVKEKEKVKRRMANNQDANGIRVVNLSKTYKQCCNKQINALKNIYLQVQIGQLLAILGHNGAGKTTLINILNGLFKPDNNQSQVIINNLSLLTDMQLIRKHIGVCPQFDILWNQLTGKEHLVLFGRLKGIPYSIIQQKIKQSLQAVKLTNKGNFKVGTYSGGMKRRLSLAIATIGSPTVIFLDQPTTGMDPVVRKNVWNLIENIKKKKAVILTTHSMQQADILSNRIAILKQGQLKCIDTSLNLKKKFGSGYRISINVNELMNNIFNNTSCIDKSAGSIIIGIPKIEQSKQADTLQKYNLKRIIKQWGVSITTLEQVFMNITKKKLQQQ